MPTQSYSRSGFKRKDEKAPPLPARRVSLHRLSFLKSHFRRKERRGEERGTAQHLRQEDSRQEGGPLECGNSVLPRVREGPDPSSRLWERRTAGSRRGC